MTVAGSLGPRHLVGCRFCLASPTWALAVMVLALHGCATSGSQGRIDGTGITIQRPVESFSLSGRISVRVDDRIDSGQLRWERDASGDRESMALLTPLGSQVAELIREGTRAEFRRGTERQAGEFAALTESLVGVALDLPAIVRWLQGAGLDAQGRGVAASSDGRNWEIQAEGLTAQGPSLVARRLTLISGGTVIKLVVDHWEVR